MQRDHQAPIHRARRPAPTPAIRTTSAVCGAIWGLVAAILSGGFLYLMMALPVAMTHGLTVGTAGEILLAVPGLVLGLLVFTASMIAMRITGDHLARAVGPRRGRLFLALITLPAVAFAGLQIFHALGAT